MPVRPDLTQRPLDLMVERQMNASAEAIYQAWTVDFAKWFAEPGTLIMEPEVNSLFFFETHFEEQRHAHYGRFLDLQPGERVEMTWVTGNPGTRGAETVVVIELEPRDGGTFLKLSHAGFYDQDTRDGHKQAWPEGLAHLDACLSE